MIKVWRGGVNFVWNSHRIDPIYAEGPSSESKGPEGGGVNFVWNSTYGYSVEISFCFGIRSRNTQR